MRQLLRDLVPGQGYAVQVRSTDGGYHSEWSTILEFVTDRSGVAPAIPTGISWTVGDNSTFLGTWSKVTADGDGGELTDLLGYQIELGVSGGVTKEVFTADSTYTLSLEDNRSFFGTPRGQVTFKIRSVDLDGNVSDWSPTFTATNPAPAAPTGLTAAGVPDGVQLKWNKNVESDLAGYRVYVGTTSGFTPTTPVTDTQATSFFYQNSTIIPYFFKVMAYDVFGTESLAATATAAPKGIFSVDTLSPKPPTGVTATITTAVDSALTTSMAVSWTAVTQNTDNSAVTDLAGYRVRYRPAGTLTWSTVSVGRDDTSVVIRNLTPYVNYEVSVQAYDWTANSSTWTAPVTGTGATNSAPPTPQAPAVSTSTMRMQVTVSGLTSALAAMPADVAYYEVDAAPTSGFTPGASTKLGKIFVGPAMVETFSIPANASSGTDQTWYVRVRAVDNAGLAGPYSAEASSSVGLISAINISDATITSAKIASLSASKITAGVINTGSITVQSSLIIGDATTNGEVRSYDWVDDSTGWRFAKGVFQVNEGEIHAQALRLQAGTNIVPPEYASFEVRPDAPDNVYKNTSVIHGRNIICTLNKQSADGTAKPLDGDQFLGTYFNVVLPLTDPQPAVWLARNSDDYNIRFEPGQKYIYSFYARSRGALGMKFIPTITYDNGTTTQLSEVTFSSTGDTWYRYHYIVTVPIDATAGYLGYVSSYDGSSGPEGFNIDCVQIERQLTGSDYPSAWSPPGLTTIDAGLIKTGSMRSTATVEVAGNRLPAWLIDMEGDAQFNSLSVRGKVIVGPEGGSDGIESYIQSSNWIAGTAGWRVNSNGSSEFADTLIKGSINASEAQFSKGVTILGTTTFGVDSTALLRGTLQDPALKPYVINDTINGPWNVLKSPNLQRAMWHGGGTSFYRAYTDTSTGNHFVQLVNSTTGVPSAAIQLKAYISPLPGGFGLRLPYFMQGAVRIGNFFYAAFNYANDNVFRQRTVIQKFDLSGNPVGGFIPGTLNPGNDISGTNLRDGDAAAVPAADTMYGVGKHHTNADILVLTYFDYKGRLVLSEVNVTTSFTGTVGTQGTATYTQWRTPAAEIQWGNRMIRSSEVANFDLGAQRLMVGAGNGVSFYSKSGSGTNAALTLDSNASFYMMEDIYSGGVTWDGLYFYSNHNTPRLRRYDGFAKNSPATFTPTWIAHAYRRSSDNKRTSPGPISEKVDWYKRHFLTIKTESSPSPGNGVSIYAYQGPAPVNTAGFYLQADVSNPNPSMTLSDIILVGTSPVVNEFGTDPGHVSTLATESGGFILRGDGTGDWPALTKRPMAARYRDAVQAIPHNTATVVAFNQSTVSDGIAWNSGTNSFTVPVTGKYAIHSAVHFVFHAGGSRYLEVLVNGSTQAVFYAAQNTVASNGTSVGIARTLSLTAGDTVAIRANQTSGTTLNIHANSSGIHTWVDIIHLGT